MISSKIIRRRTKKQQQQQRIPSASASSLLSSMLPTYAAPASFSSDTNTNTNSTKPTNSRIADSDISGNNRKLAFRTPSKKNTIWKRLKIGSRVGIYWEDDSCYYPGTVVEERKDNGDNPNNTSRFFFVRYDDGETEWTDMAQEQLRWLDDDADFDNDKNQEEESEEEEVSPNTAGTKSYRRSIEEDIVDDEDDEWKEPVEYDEENDEDDGSVFDEAAEEEEWKDDDWMVTSNEKKEVDIRLSKKRKKAKVEKIVKITRHEESAAADDNSADNSKDQAVKAITLCLRDTDVIFGNNVCRQLQQNHPGNVAYKVLLKTYVSQFYRAPRSERRLIVGAVVQEFHGRRFLTKSTKDFPTWVDLTGRPRLNGKIITYRDKIRKDFMVLLATDKSLKKKLDEEKKENGQEVSATVAATLATVATDVDNSIGNTQTGDYLYTLLEHPALFHERLQLSDFNQLLLQHVEVKEATKADVDSPQRMAPLQVGHIGFRCRHCTEYVVYPHKLSVMGHNMYHLGTHLMNNNNTTKNSSSNRKKKYYSSSLRKPCRHVPDHVRLALIESKPRSTSQSMKKEFIGLPTYLKMIVHEFGIVEQDGALRLQVSVNHKVSSAVGGSLPTPVLPIDNNATQQNIDPTITSTSEEEDEKDYLKI